MDEWRFQSSSELDGHHVRHEIMKRLRSQSVGDFAGAELVLGELLGNVVRYAPGPVSMRVDWACGSPVLTVHDEGEAFTPTFTLPVDPMSEGGRGLYLVQRFSTSVRVTDVPGDGTKVEASLPLVRLAQSAA